MNARELLTAIEAYGRQIITADQAEWAVVVSALRLLAAAEANDGTTPETDRVTKSWPLESFGPMADLARRLERERNGLAARVRELEAALLSILSAKRHDPNRGRGSEGQFVTMNIKAEIVAQADAAIDAARGRKP